MAIEIFERDVTSILYKINAFWSSSLMEDRHVIDQTWRGYHCVVDNLYTQLYQLHYSKCIHSITPNWVSHWERFDFNESNKTDTFNSLYPFAFKFQDNIKTVYLLRESPREVVVLPSASVLLNNGLTILPDGTARLPGDLFYQHEDAYSFKEKCVYCDGTGVTNSETCPVCDGSTYMEGVISEAGFAVKTVKYLKRADSINDYEETVTPLGDFVVDEANKIIAFRTEPYPTLWSQYAIRDTEIIYDNFGSLMQFYKKDSFRYLRQTQGLWYAYWNGSTVGNIEIGLTVLTDLPFAYDAGYVSSINYLKNTFLTSRQVPAPSDFVNSKIEIPVEPPLDDFGKHAIIIKIREKPSYVLTEGVDFELFSQYRDAGDYLNWYAFNSFNNINAIPEANKIAYLKFNLTETTAAIAEGDNLDIYFEDGSGYYIVTVNGRDYFFSDENVPAVVVNQYVNRYQPLTDSIQIYDHVNFPKWWEYLLGYRQSGTYFKKYGRVKFDSGVKLNNDINLDSFSKHSVKAELLYHHTFLVALSENTVPHTVEGVQLLKAFLDTIKPSYSHYIIRCQLDFEDNCEVQEAHFALECIYNFKSNQGPTQRLDDSWIREKLNNNISLDSLGKFENLFVAKLPLDGIRFISSTEVHSCCYDSLEKNTLDRRAAMDKNSKSSNLSVTKELP